MWEYRARAVRVHDGDTLTVEVDLGFTARVEIDVRLADVWAPELGERGGLETRQHLHDLVASAAGKWPLTITTERVRSDEREVRTFTRYVATVLAHGASGVLNVNDVVSAFVAERGYGGGAGT